MLGKLVLELRDDPGVAAITTRIRSPRPGPGDAGWDTDPQGNRRFKHAFVVLVPNGGGRLPGFRMAPVTSSRVIAMCYGRDSVEAEELYQACSAAIHGIGPRLYPNGVAIYQSFDDAGPAEEIDPDTQQPHYDFTIEALAATQVVA